MPVGLALDDVELDPTRSKTLGVLGLGNIGSEVARIGLAFGMNVIAWSQNLTKEKAQSCEARLVSKEELFYSADILTIHVVLSQRTKGLVGAAELQAMKPSARIINTSVSSFFYERKQKSLQCDWVRYTHSPMDGSRKS